ncbi:MAG: EAL domain-containing protein [Devosia sp.]
MQSLVYIFIALAGLGIGAAAYFGLTFTPIEAFVTVLAFVAVAVMVVERTLRRRAEGRIERAIEDLSRLLSTDAQAGAVLGQRIAALTDENAGQRLDALEADLSVLGTVVRQVAESVAELEEQRRRQVNKAAAATVKAAIAGPPLPDPVIAKPAVAEPAPTAPADVPTPPTQLEPVIPLEMLKQAIEDGRLVLHLQPIVTLPQRKAHSYDLVPRLTMEDGEFADPPDFMPRKGGEVVIRRIERLCLEEAITIVRRSRTAGQPATIYVPISRTTLVDAAVIDKIVVLLEANSAVASSIVLAVDETDWRAMPLSERAALAAFASRGLRLSLTNAGSLRLDFAELAGEGVRSVRVDAARFIDEPESFSDFHSSDVTSYMRRFEVDLIATGIHTEEQILTLLEDGVTLAGGPYIGGPGGVRADLVVDRPVLEKTAAEA